MRRVIPMKDFNCALASLDDVPVDLVRDLACRIAAHPERTGPSDGNGIRMVKTRTYGAYPAVRLFFRFDEQAVYLTNIEIRDELEIFDHLEMWERLEM